MIPVAWPYPVYVYIMRTRAGKAMAYPRLLSVARWIRWAPNGRDHSSHHGRMDAICP